MDKISKTNMATLKYGSKNTPTKDTQIQYQPGVICIIIKNRCSIRILKNTEDKLGRWAYVKLTGKHGEKITCMGLYRFNPGSIRTIDDISAWR